MCERDVRTSHQLDWNYYKQSNFVVVVVVAGTCNKILLLVLNSKIETFIFRLRLVAIKTDELVTLVHTVRINKPEANIAARPQNVWTFLFLMYSAAF